jgi:hypothetical protein
MQHVHELSCCNIKNEHIVMKFYYTRKQFLFKYLLHCEHPNNRWA